MKLNSILFALCSSGLSKSGRAFTPSTYTCRSTCRSTCSSTRLHHGPPKNEPRHDTSRSTPSASDLSPAEVKTQALFAEHQAAAPKLGFPTDVRTLIEYNHGFAVISTHSKRFDGYPNGSVVGFAPDADGSPVFVFSGMSSHTQDLLVDPRCSLTVASKQFKGAADGRVNLMGTVRKLPQEDVEAARDLYLDKHPDAFWVTFGDFTWFRMDVERVNFVGGFARAGSITSEEYRDAEPDAVSQFGMHIADHMNDDHMESTIAIIESQVPGINAEEALITSVDSLGMYVKVTRTPVVETDGDGDDDGDEEEVPKQTFKMRLPFPRKAEDRKDVKNVIVEMTRAAAPAVE